MPTTARPITQPQSSRVLAVASLLFAHASIGGVAAARNLALRHATGDLVHFLDSDNILANDAVAAKVAALRAVPDADVCYAQRTNEYLDPALPRQAEPVRPLRGPDSPADNSLAMLTSCRFIVSAALVPRHLLVAVGGFDERLRGAEDYHLWARLALVGVKVIALDRVLVRRRLARDSLTFTPAAGQPWEVFARILVMADCFGRPALWRTAWTMLLFTRTWPGWAAVCDESNVHAAPFRSALAERIVELPKTVALHGLSARPLLAVLDGVVRSRPLATMPEIPTSYELATSEAIAVAWRSAADAGARDHAHWLTVPPLTEEIPALRDIAAAYDRALKHGTAWLRPAEMLWFALPPRFTRPWRSGWRNVWLVGMRLGRPAERMLAAAPLWLRNAAGVVLRRLVARALRDRSRGKLPAAVR